MAQSPSNNPPSPIDFARSLIKEISDWMADTPVIETEADARQAKLLMDRAKAAFAEIEAERTAKVKPLNDQVAEINAEYKAVHNTDGKKPGVFDKTIAVLKQRAQAYLLIEEARRRRAAEEQRVAAAAAEAAAREAERLEREAIENAKVGEVGIDIAEISAGADEKFNEYKQLERAASRAEKAAEDTRLTGGFGRAVSIREREVLTVDDWRAAIDDMGLTDQIVSAILTSARAFRSATGDLPHGIKVTYERSL